MHIITPPSRPSTLLVFATEFLLFRLLFISTFQRLSLRLDSLLSPLTGSLRLRTLGVHLLLEDLLTLLLGLGSVDLWIC